MKQVFIILVLGVLALIAVPGTASAVRVLADCHTEPEYCVPFEIKIATPKMKSTATGTVEIKVELIEPPLPIEKYEIEYYIDLAIKKKEEFKDSVYAWDTTKVKNGYHFIGINVCNKKGGVASTFVIVKVENKKEDEE